MSEGNKPTPETAAADHVDDSEYDAGREFGRQNGRQYGSSRRQMEATRSPDWLMGYYDWEALEGPCITQFTDAKGMIHYYEGNLFDHMGPQGPRVTELEEVFDPYGETAATWSGRFRSWLARWRA